MTSAAGAIRILVVDDEPAIRRFLRAGLGAQGYALTELGTGLPAIDVVRRKGTDLIVPILLAIGTYLVLPAVMIWGWVRWSDGSESL